MQQLFEMSLPHAPRIKQLAADGAEEQLTATDVQHWELYYTVQQALQQADTAAEGQQEEEGQAAKPAADAAKAPQPSDPQKVLEKLLTARGELDVITDLITFVEQQQFLAVEGVHRHPPSLEERVRARSLRLAASKQQLRGAAARLQAGLAALQAQSRIDNRFLADLAQLRQRWKLRHHGGAAGLFYADLALPLRGAAVQGVTQEGAQCNIIQDTNGDACIVETGTAGRRRAVRGWQQIHAVLERRQQLLAWRVLQQLLDMQARQQQYEADPDGAVAAVQRMAAAAAAACQAALHRAAEGGSSGGEPGGADAMEVDAGSSGVGGGDELARPQQQQQQQQQQQAVAAAAALAPPSSSSGGGGGSSSSSSMMSSVAQDIQAAVELPGLQQQFEGQALLLLSRLLVVGGGGSGGGGGSSSSSGQQQLLLERLLQWLRHMALSQRVNTALRGWAAASPGRSLQQIDSHEEFAAVWQLAGTRGGAAAVPVLVIVQGGCVRIEGTTGSGAAATAALTPAAAQRGLSRAELQQALLNL